jgi:hypothetical protein
MHLRPHIVAAASWSLTRGVAFARAASDLTEMSIAISGRGVEQEDEG